MPLGFGRSTSRTKPSAAGSIEHAKQILRTAGLGLVGLVAGGAIAITTRPAAAYFEVLSALGCKKENPYNSHSYPTSDQSATIQNSGTSSGFICPLPDRTKLPIQSIAEILVDVHDASSSSLVHVKLCAGSYASGSANFGGTGHDACGFDSGATTNPNVGYYSLNLDMRDAQTNHYWVLDAGETGYLFVDLPNGSSLLRIRVED